MAPLAPIMSPLAPITNPPTNNEANGGSDDDAHDEDTYDLPTDAILGEEIAPKDNNKEHLSFTQDLVVSSHPLLKQDHQPERV
ncbi:hypothetical protein MJO28_013847 [Puccinia striiformis f. sp. tritici]|uniref:Uncharacterized protein n=2 Tax=Puccinia striiformis TaxID=27350 RepID=A0A2S4URA3_9BASI|nr:hypothetical protein MJO28_013847 [Puccinia striiformis f. sp. tritici]POV99852.1 hypothetical protein PSHT_13360 [Puccinia striiformis]